VGLILLSANILADTIAAVGLLIAFYYGLTGFACAWFYRKTMWRRPRDILLMQGVLPLLGGILLLAFFFVAAKTYADPAYGFTSIAGVGGVFLIGIGSLLLGVVLMFCFQAVAPAYFRGETLPKAHSGDLLLVGGGDQPVGVRLPDTRERTVIGPDLSNLPPGQEAVDPSTGRRVHRGDAGEPEP
jgi:hypothetical protein